MPRYNVQFGQASNLSSTKRVKVVIDRGAQVSSQLQIAYGLDNVNRLLAVDVDVLGIDVQPGDCIAATNGDVIHDVLLTTGSRMDIEEVLECYLAQHHHAIVEQHHDSMMTLIQNTYNAGCNNRELDPHHVELTYDMLVDVFDTGMLSLTVVKQLLKFIAANTLTYYGVPAIKLPCSGTCRTRRYNRRALE
jgi:hypothetical protein